MRTASWSVVFAGAAAAFVHASGALAGGGPDGYAPPGAYVAPSWPQAASPPTPLSPVPEPGRATLQIESDGPPQVIGYYLGVSYRWTRRGRRVAYPVHQDVCTTPCQVFAPPGMVSLYASGSGIEGRPLDIGIPPSGIRLRLGAPSSAALVGGVLLTTFGGIAMALTAVFLPVGLGSDTPGLTIAGGVLAAAGAAMLTPGIVLLAVQQYGITWSGPPLGAPGAPSGANNAVVGATRHGAHGVGSLVSLGASPIAGGALAGATLRF